VAAAAEALAAAAVPKTNAYRLSPIAFALDPVVLLTAVYSGNKFKLFA